MTADSSVNNQLCQSCNADIRPGSMFCYSCGTAVASKSKTENGNESQKNNYRNPAQAIGKPDLDAGKPIGKPSSISAEKEVIKPDNKKLVVEKEEVLPTAASVKRQAKPAPKKKVEIVWEQPENSVNILFVIATLILVALAAGALLAMIYLR